MKLPERFRIMIITLSDRASRGEYNDLSGPRIADLLSEFFEAEGFVYETEIRLIPDDKEMLKDLLLKSAGVYDIIFTTGGTGIGPRDITVETVRPLLSKEITGIMDYIRIKYGSVNPAALLSCGVAGVMNGSLIYTLPGSVRAVEEYISEIVKTLKHSLQMIYGIDSHNKTH
jgi:molybdenum cofactor synthesis domain-containing protein